MGWAAPDATRLKHMYYLAPCDIFAADYGETCVGVNFVPAVGLGWALACWALALILRESRVRTRPAGG